MFRKELTWLQHVEKVGKEVYDKDGEAGTGLTYKGHFLVTRGRHFSYIPSSVRSFGTDFSMR